MAISGFNPRTTNKVPPSKGQSHAMRSIQPTNLQNLIGNKGANVSPSVRQKGKKKGLKLKPPTIKHTPRNFKQGWMGEKQTNG